MSQNLFSHKKCTGGVALSPGVYVTAGTDGRIALFLTPFNTAIIGGHNYEIKNRN